MFLSARRLSKASKEGSLRENIAKADIKASATEMDGSPERGSLHSSNRFRNRVTKQSAERCFRTIRVFFMSTSVLWSRKKEQETGLDVTKTRYICPVFYGENADAGSTAKMPRLSSCFS